jgi:hypothetical protein
VLQQEQLDLWHLILPLHRILPVPAKLSVVYPTTPGMLGNFPELSVVFPTVVPNRRA